MLLSVSMSDLQRKKNSRSYYTCNKNCMSTFSFLSCVTAFPSPLHRVSFCC